MHLAINLFYLLFLFFVSPWILYRAIRYGRYRRGWMEKLFGLLPLQPRSSATDFNPPTRIWLHAVSVGEVQLMRTLVVRIKKERPDWQLVLSASTDSGYELARQLFPNDQVVFAPFDFTWAIANAWKRIQPSLLVLMELELWPNWLRHAQNENCPIAVVNGRLSANSFQGYRRISRLVRPMFTSLSWVGAQTEEYADRFHQLGVLDTALEVTGNLKFDGAEPNRSASEVLERRQLLSLDAAEAISPDAACEGSNSFVWVAGSTQDPEEEIVLNVFQHLAPRFPQLKLVLVPRHPERFEEVAQKVEATKHPWARRSECQSTKPHPSWRIFLGDSVGELRWWWGLADVAFVGGSFGDRGGQNMIEPCAFGVATCFGPNTKNFSDVVDLLLKDGACVQLQTPDNLTHFIEQMISDRDHRTKLGASAQRAAAEHRGAIDRTWQGISKLLSPAILDQSRH
ncbi:MAG: 3-deoxy-D-manno-octulosonic acid transferase [Pirellula sp.]|jgi:3-deoxy-D-manno-octulosonic-acid transferase|nr:3-deoxy-D-manno-octulosonic acid transferase [Pirellula sp.]